MEIMKKTIMLSTILLLNAINAYGAETQCLQIVEKNHTQNIVKPISREEALRVGKVTLTYFDDFGFVSTPTGSIVSFKYRNSGKDFSRYDAENRTVLKIYKKRGFFIWSWNTNGNLIDYTYLCGRSFNSVARKIPK